MLDHTIMQPEAYRFTTRQERATSNEKKAEELSNADETKTHF